MSIVLAARPPAGRLGRPPRLGPDVFDNERAPLPVRVPASDLETKALILKECANPKSSGLGRLVAKAKFEVKAMEAACFYEALHTCADAHNMRILWRAGALAKSGMYNVLELARDIAARRPDEEAVELLGALHAEGCSLWPCGPADRAECPWEFMPAQVAACRKKYLTLDLLLRNRAIKKENDMSLYRYLCVPAYDGTRRPVTSREAAFLLVRTMTDAELVEAVTEDWRREEDEEPDAYPGPVQVEAAGELSHRRKGAVFVNAAMFAAVQARAKELQEALATARAGKPNEELGPPPELQQLSSRPAFSTSEAARKALAARRERTRVAAESRVHEQTAIDETPFPPEVLDLAMDARNEVGGSRETARTAQESLEAFQAIRQIRPGNNNALAPRKVSKDKRRAEWDESLWDVIEHARWDDFLARAARHPSLVAELVLAAGSHVYDAHYDMSETLAIQVLDAVLTVGRVSRVVALFNPGMVFSVANAGEGAFRRLLAIGLPPELLHHPLQMFAYKGYVNAAQSLIRAGAGIEYPSLLALAASRKPPVPEMVDMLLAAGAPAEGYYVNDQTRTMICNVTNTEPNDEVPGAFKTYFVRNPKTRVMDCFMTDHSDWSDVTRNIPLVAAAAVPQNKSVLTALLRAGVDPHIRGDAALRVAFEGTEETWNSDNAQVLISYGARMPFFVEQGTENKSVFVSWITYGGFDDRPLKMGGEYDVKYMKVPAAIRSRDWRSRTGLVRSSIIPHAGESDAVESYAVQLFGAELDAETKHLKIDKVLSTLYDSVEPAT